MNVLTLVLAAIIVVMLSGGLYFYYKIFKRLYKESGEFMNVVFVSLKDRKISVAEKEKIMKEYSDISPILKELKSKFVDDAKDLGEDFKNAYTAIKKKVKSKK
jgi:hypothetical protein